MRAAHALPSPYGRGSTLSSRQRSRCVPHVTDSICNEHALIPEREGARLDALARRGVRRRVRIIERRMRVEARRHALVGVEYLEHHRLVALHAREVEPLVLGIVGDVIDLAGAILVPALHQDEALLRNAAAIADAERIDHDRPANRPPHLDDGPALLEAPLGLVIADNLAQPLRRRSFGIVVVYALHRRPRTGLLLHLLVADPDGVVEHMDVRGAGMFPDQLAYLDIVDALALGLVGEILHPGVVVDEYEAVGVEPECVAQRPTVVDRD